MPDPRPLMGLYGKVPAHGDFVRRGLPSSFVGPWDAWLQQGMAAAREALGPRWPAAWDEAPPWRFALPAGACGPDAVAGVMLPSEDMVGRRFPVTLAALLAPGAATPGPGWFAALEAAALAGRAGQADADALAAAIPRPGEEPDEPRLPFLASVAPVMPAPADTAAWDPAPGLSAPALDTPLPAESLDVLALFADGGGAATPAASPCAGEADASPTAAAEDVLALLGGGAAIEPALLSTTAESCEDDVLARLAGAGAGPPEEAMPPGPDGRGGDPADIAEDGTLAFLIGEAGSVATCTSGEEAAAAPDAPHAAASQAAPAEPAPAEALPDDPLLLPPPIAAEPPPAPPGGGWWTGGAARLPPTAWPLPALPPAEEFIRLLDADA